MTEDRELFDIIQREEERQNTTLQLIASENFTSRAVMAATGSVLTNKYSEGYPGKRYYGGNYVIDEVEDLARRRACQLFGAEHANVQPHAGATPTWPPTWPCSTPATPFSGCDSTRAAISPTARRSTSAAASTGSCPTESPTATSGWISTSWRRWPPSTGPS